MCQWVNIVSGSQYCVRESILCQWVNIVSGSQCCVSESILCQGVNIVSGSQFCIRESILYHVIQSGSIIAQSNTTKILYTYYSEWGRTQFWDCTHKRHSSFIEGILLAGYLWYILVGKLWGVFCENLDKIDVVLLLLGAIMPFTIWTNVAYVPWQHMHHQGPEIPHLVPWSSAIWEFERESLRVWERERVWEFEREREFESLREREFES